MRRGQLKDYFAAAAVKSLTSVDCKNAGTSNQHEIGTTKEMRRQFLGECEQRFQTLYVWLGEDQFSTEGTATHYDTRLQQPTRAPEWRLYYPSNSVTDNMREHDALFLAMTNDGRLYFIVAPYGSTSEQQLSYLFNLYPNGRSFVSREVANDETELDFSTRFILGLIGVELKDPDTDGLDEIIERFGETFPKTDEFSDLARETLSVRVSAKDDPDTALVEWVKHEEALFKRLERRIVAPRLDKDFRDNSGIADVDGFIQYSLSVHNRRKARMGQALEHHVEAVFRAHEIAYVRGAETEDKKKPDFLFPSAEAYQVAPDVDSAGLTMLGVKSSAKDRWRQVLDEASKIPTKHLLTIEPAISVRQTTQMARAKLQLVVPRGIQASYTDEQRAWLWSVSDFMKYVRDVSTRA